MKRYILNLHFVLSAVLLICGFAPAQAPAEIEEELLKILSKIEETGSYAGNYDEEKNSAANDQFAELLGASIKRPDILEYQFSSLKERMFITTSPDGNLRIYSWDTNTGGTMRAYSSLFQYKDKQGKINGYKDPSDEIVGDGFYHDIFQLKTNQNTIYLAVSTFIASTSLHGQNIGAIEISRSGLDFNRKIFRTSSGLKNSIGFSYDFFSVYEREERPIKLFEYDEKRKILKFPIVIEDDKTPQGRVTDKWIRYKFNATNFVRIK